MQGLYGRWSLTWKMGLLGGSFPFIRSFFSEYLLFWFKVYVGLWVMGFCLSEVFWGTYLLTL